MIMRRNKFLAVACVLASLTTSCEKADFTAETSPDEEMSELTVYTRLTEGEEMQYPILVSAFDSNGRCCAQYSISDGEPAFTFTLPPDSYNIVALGGISASTCKVPQRPKYDSYLTLKEEADRPLQIGRADISVGGSTTAYLQMQYVVANVNVSLSEIPSNVTAVSMTLSKPYSQWSFSGKGNAPATFTYNLKQGEQPGQWRSGNTYVLPTEGAATLTINLTSSQGSTSYSYTCPEPLRSGVPYVLNGSYAIGDLSVEGEFAVEGWAEAVNWNFNFGPGASTEEVTPPQSGDQPIVGQLWQNHIVAYVEDLNDTEWSVYLLSREEAEEMPSAWSENDDPTKALAYAAAYTEDNLSGWTIPSKEEAQMLQQSLGGENLIRLNTVLTQEGLPLFLDYEPGSNPEKEPEKARYLCDNAEKSFSMAEKNSPTKGGPKKKYRLRLIKEIIVEK